MTEKLSVVTAVDPARVERNTNMAESLRKLADRALKNELPDLCVIFSDRESRGFVSFGDFEDRWRLVAAIENAKHDVLHS